MAAFLSHPLNRTETAPCSVHPARLGIQTRSVSGWVYQGPFRIGFSEPNGEEDDHPVVAAAVLSATVLEEVVAAHLLSATLLSVATVAVYRRFDFYLS
jgi:hypothetical protein